MTIPLFAVVAPVRPTVPPDQVNAPMMVSVPAPPTIPLLIDAVAALVGPLKLVVPFDEVKEVVKAVLPEKVMVPPETVSVLRELTEATVNGPFVMLSVPDPCTFSELMV